MCRIVEEDSLHNFQSGICLRSNSNPTKRWNVATATKIRTLCKERRLTSSEQTVVVIIMGNATAIAGAIGLGLSLGLWLMSSWRLAFHTMSRRRQQHSDGMSPSTSRAINIPNFSYLTYRRMFHCLLWLATSCECVAYADISRILSLSSDRLYAKKLGYILLDMAGRSVLEFSAFVVVTAMWYNTAIQASTDAPTGTFRKMIRLLLPLLCMVAMILLFFSSVAVSLGLLQNGRQEPQGLPALPFWYRSQVLIELVAWALHSALVLECIVLTAKRINLVAGNWWRHPSMSAKTLLPMFISSTCYALRSGWLLYQYFRIEPQFQVDPVNATDRFGWAWWIGFCWAPTLANVASLLYSARKRDHVEVTDRSMVDPLLLGSPVPPAEAFLAFSRHRFSEDLCDDSLFGSPMLRVIRTENVEVGDEETLSTYSGSPIEPS